MVVTFILRLDLVGKYNAVDVSYFLYDMVGFYSPFFLFKCLHVTAHIKYRQCKCLTQPVFRVRFCEVHLSQVKFEVLTKAYLSSQACCGYWYHISIYFSLRDAS